MLRQIKDKGAISMNNNNNHESGPSLASGFQRQKAAYSEKQCPTIAERKARLKQLKALLNDNQEAICLAINSDFNGRAKFETLSAEFLPSVMAINDALRQLSSWARPEYKILPWLFQPAVAKVIAQPLGVVGIIVPWNYPLMLAVGPLVAALSAGNSAMVKMSEDTPNFSFLFAHLVSQYFDEAIVTICTGGIEVAQQFSSLPFDHLLFTGSTAVGKQVMNAASANLTPVTLELGGKSPAVVDRSIPIREAAERLVYPKCLNAGQTCVAPDYVLCPEELVDDFVQHFLAETKRQYGAIEQNDQYTAIINVRQRTRLINYVDEAKSSGAEIYIAGDEEDLNCYGNKLPPILMTNVAAHCLVLHEEIFGPILPIISYQTRDQALAYINERPRPLALYVFGYDKTLRTLYSQRTHSGALVFNEAIIHAGMDNLPFGGIGASGMGQYHGKYGFETFSKRKPVVFKQRISSFKLLYPPYKGWITSIINRLLRS